MTHLFWYFVGSVVTAHIYDKHVAPTDKQKWENSVMMHHGEVGILMVLAGLLTKSPGLAAAGAGLALHDSSDHGLWFTGDKSRKQLL